VHRKIVRSVVITALALAVAATSAALALNSYPPLAGAAFWLRYSPGAQCSAVETVRSVAYHREWGAIHKRILDSARLVQTDGAMQLWDVPGMRQFWIHGTFDKMNALAFAEEAAGQYWHPSVHFQPGDIVLDVGADAGSVTFEALRAGAQKVVAIEVSPDKWPCLERTFAKEIAEQRVVLVRAGAWDSESTMELGGDSVVLERGSQKQKVRVTTIDRMIAELKLPRVDFISMDIEGAEKPALRGAMNTLRKFRPRMAIASEHLPDDVEAIPKTVRAIAPGYEVICGQCELRGGALRAQVLWFK
jgi:FkbM family methyltransferase